MRGCYLCSNKCMSNHPDLILKIQSTYLLIRAVQPFLDFKRPPACSSNQSYSVPIFSSPLLLNFLGSTFPWCLLLFLFDPDARLARLLRQNSLLGYVSYDDININTLVKPYMYPQYLNLIIVNYCHFLLVVRQCIGFACIGVMK